MKMKILLADDEKDIVEFMKYNLEMENFEVITAYDGQEAMEKLPLKPDLVILDVMMPLIDGYEVCRRIKAGKDTESIPVIFLTARGAESDEVRGLDLGADDYIQKPISPKKLIARVNSNLRRFSKDQENERLVLGPVVIDRGKYLVSLNGVEVQFPRKEFELLSYLAQHPGQVFPREKILSDVWGSDILVVERTIDVHIRKIREKFGPYANMIETVKGVGYKFSRMD